MNWLSGVQIDEGSAIGLIPARGGSKSIPMKNIALVGDRPLIGYVISAGLKSDSLDGIYCSTDHQAIADVCIAGGVEVLDRPTSLGEDDTPVADVVVNVLETLGRRFGRIPGMVALLQPTSPFVLAEHIDRCVQLLISQPSADSVQTVCPVLHNNHAFNQRVIDDEGVHFRFLEERRSAYNKQRKPKHYVFGNIVVTRSRSLLAGQDCFGDVSFPVVIPRIYALDVDTADDLDYADYLVRRGSFTLND
ncbi:MAG: acylneuraminate cytidylyltransferase family protein [Polaromonas sp.]|uniref:acylneuraminate cytidylyltransferase family protein n=1 Tax=Polaromonas sp. TaxID=1869339 RepID=UPI0025FFE10A|nr:acylneuraminate cytidylyltransferase family protein [Polaromonas sp.]MBI2725904.1 acylneuraminate cytidylyltransferase family protein [Polaromonas sp.]